MGCEILNVFDLGLEATQMVIRIDNLLNLNPEDLVDDLIAYGNFQWKLDNLPKAIEAFKKVIDIGLKNNDYSNAASASTNLAIILINNKQVDEGIKLLENSLEYLSRKPFPQTEFITRLTYLQVANFKDMETERVLRVAEGLNQHKQFLRPDLIQVIAEPIIKYIDKYVLINKTVDKTKYLNEKFPWLNQ